MDFIPDKPNFEVPRAITFEQGVEQKIAGWSLSKPIEYYQSAVTEAMGKLGGLVTSVVPGRYGNRYGFRFSFIMGTVQGRIDCAALPIQNETPAKKAAAQKQALYLLSLELESAYNSWVYKPGTVPLTPYLIGAGGKTVTETLIETKMLPEIVPAGQLPG